jgi:hypothetical protein
MVSASTTEPHTRQVAIALDTVPFSGSKSSGNLSDLVSMILNSTLSFSIYGFNATFLLFFLANQYCLIKGISALHEMFWHGIVLAHI